MHLIGAMFDALRSFDRPATVRELQRESGLDRDAVHNGLRGLARRGIVIKDTLPRCRGTYRLAPAATRPVDARGRFARDTVYRDTLRRAALAYHAGLGARQENPTPSPPAPSAGAPRIVARGVLFRDAGATHPTAAPCTLAECWSPSPRPHPAGG